MAWGYILIPLGTSRNLRDEVELCRRSRMDFVFLTPTLPSTQLSSCDNLQQPMRQLFSFVVQMEKKKHHFIKHKTCRMFIIEY